MMTTTTATMVAMMLVLVLVTTISMTSLTVDARQDPLVDWLRTKPGGYFSDKVEWKQFNPQDPNSPYGMFAKADIPKDEKVIVIPQSAMINGGDAQSTTDEEHSPCQTVDRMVEEYHLGAKSAYYPYIQYLFGDDTKKGKLPSAWSPKAKRLLGDMLGHDLLPPRGQVFSHSYARDCALDGQEDQVTQLHEDAYLFMISRSWYDVMIPLYDMINHRNGHYRNMEGTSAHNGKDITVYAYRDIARGEQLYNSYNECLDSDCAGLKYEYVTQNILMDYGFLENYPRRWTINYNEDDPMILEVYQNETTGEKYAVWPFAQDTLPLGVDELNWIRAQLTRLRAMEGYLKKEVQELQSDHERGVLLDYHAGYMEAFEMAIQYREEGIKKNTKNVYNPLVESTGPAVEGVNTIVCLDGGGTSRAYHTTDSTESQYQEIEFTYNEDEDNTCLQLSGWIQACSAFRPHYHEAFVHVPAQYVDKVKRVAFLGGGDNMILHEILKFPDLELVVGMELDQQVIRSSFKHLGTLPYFDDPRVQWWFGDATKSLFALPEEYYGSFDLVLVDLQTFVADALKVTDKLSIMDTAVLLMKQEGGVIAKNEDFPVRTNVGFAKYTVDLEYHDVPHICMQSITMGSNSVDFMTATPKYHEGVETLAVDLVGQKKTDDDSGDVDPFRAFFGYRISNPHNCEANEEGAVPSGGLKDPIGVMVVVEAENLSMPSLNSMPDVKAALSGAMKELNLSEMAISSHEELDAKAFVVILHEGYVTARIFAEQKYIAFDLMLWDCLDRVDSIKQTVVEAVGGTFSDMKTSSFRFVAAGMSGLEQCQKNVVTQIAAETEESFCKTLSGEENIVVTDLDAAPIKSFMKAALQNLATYLKPTAGVDATAIAVFCGSNTACPSLEVMNKFASETKNVKVVPMYACESFEDMPACQEQFTDKLGKAVSENKKLDIMVLDASFPFAMGQIIDNVFSNKVTYGNLLEESQLVLTPVPAGESWRKVLLDQFRTALALFDPAHRANLQFHKDGKFVELCVFSSGDGNFFRFLSTAISSIEKKTGWKPSVEEVANGIINAIAAFNPPKIFKDSDYDKTRALSQWTSQTPVGHQTLYQFALLPPKTPVEVEERILAENEPGPWDMEYSGAVVKKVLDSENYSVLYDGDNNEVVISRAQIRKFSPADKDYSTLFQVGDLIFYENTDGFYQNGVISKLEGDNSYSIYLLNTSGQKLYGVPRSKLMYQFESSDFVEDVPELTRPALLAAFGTALQTTILKDSTSAPAMQSFNVGSGVVITAFWPEGHGILEWDGLKRVDINLFTYAEDVESRVEFQDAFAGEIDYMNGVARDEHARGHGRIVNFASEVKEPPLWISKLQQKE